MLWLYRRRPSFLVLQKWLGERHWRVLWSLYSVFRCSWMLSRSFTSAISACLAWINHSCMRLRTPSLMRTCSSGNRSTSCQGWRQSGKSELKSTTRLRRDSRENHHFRHDISAPFRRKSGPRETRWKPSCTSWASLGTRSPQTFWTLAKESQTAVTLCYLESGLKGCRKR